MSMQWKAVAVILSLGLSVPVAGPARADDDEDLLATTPGATEAPVVDDSSEAEQPAPDDDAFAAALAAANAVADQGGTGTAAANAFVLTLKQQGGTIKPCYALAISLALSLSAQGIDARALTYALSKVSC